MLAIQTFTCRKALSITILKKYYNINHSYTLRDSKNN